jgi:hypothetical protein
VVAAVWFTDLSMFSGVSADVLDVDSGFVLFQINNYNLNYNTKQ